MKFLTDRQEIAKALNSGKYPVLVMDINKPKRGWDDVYECCRVRIDLQKTWNGWPEYINTTAMIYVDNYHKGIPNTVENRLKTDITLQNFGSFLSADFGARDIYEMAEKSTATVVKENQDVAVVYKWMDPDKGIMAAVRIMNVGRVDRHCSTAAILKDVE